MTERIGFSVDLSKKMEVTTANGAQVEASIVEVSKYAICLQYTDERGRTWQHWFHPTGRRMGDSAPEPMKFVDPYGAVTLL